MTNHSKTAFHGQFLLNLAMVLLISLYLGTPSAGAFGYIEKPIDTETFEAEIDGHLQKNRGDKER